MGIPERKERHRVEMRRLILGVAEELFAQEGFGNVSMRKIAEKIEYSPTTIYRLFRNKAEIMDHLIAEGYRGVYARYEKVLAEPKRSPRATLARVIEEYVDFALEHPNHYQLWFTSGELRLEDGRLEMRHGTSSYTVYGTWLQLIDECKERGELPDRETLALFQLIWGCVHGLISLRIHYPEFPWLGAAQHVDAMLALMQDGLTPHTPEVPGAGGSIRVL